MLDFLFSLTSFAWIGALALFVIVCIVITYRGAIEAKSWLPLVAIPSALTAALCFWFMSNLEFDAKVEVIVHVAWQLLLLAALVGLARGWWKNGVKKQDWVIIVGAPALMALVVWIAYSDALHLQEYLAAPR